MMPLSRHLLRTNFAFLLVGFIALMAIVATNFWLSERAQTYFDDAIASRDMRVATVELRNALQTAEASQRGFIITANEIYLAPYQTAKIEAQRRLLALQRLAPLYPDASVKTERLTSLLLARFSEMDQTIALKRDGYNAQVLQIIQSNKGKAVTDEANVFFAGIIGQADASLTAGVAEQRANSLWLRLVSLSAAFIIVAVVISASTIASRYTRDLKAARDRVNRLNEELEDRVTQRTLDLAQARDRAEVLLAEVNHRVANSLSLVSSFVRLQSKASPDEPTREALSDIQDRIFAISLIHKRLYGSSNVRFVQLSEYLAGLLDHLQTSLRSQGDGVTLSYEIDPIELETDKSVSLGVLITELVTNAFKYAYPDGVGRVRVKVTAKVDKIEVSVEDDGVGRNELAPPTGTGVGTKIINAMARGLGTDVKYRDRGPGTCAYLALPVAPRAA